jgi:hypothetical protein
LPKVGLYVHLKFSKKSGGGERDSLCAFQPFLLRYYFANSDAPLANGLTSSLQSGLYGESLRLAVNDREKTLTGYFNSAGGYLAGEGWDCNFYFSGHIKDNMKVDVVATSTNLAEDEVRTEAKGVIIKPNGGQDAVILKLLNGISGCARGEDFGEDTPAPRTINTRNDAFEPVEIRNRSNSFEFRVVKAEKSYFYETDGAKRKQKKYVICGDVVLVKEKGNATKRAKAVYMGTNKATEGWLNLEDLLEVGRTLRCPGDP